MLSKLESDSMVSDWDMFNCERKAVIRISIVNLSLLFSESHDKISWATVHACKA